MAGFDDEDRTIAVVLAAAATGILYTSIFFAEALDVAKDRHREIYNLRNVTKTGFFGNTWTEPYPVAISDLDFSNLATIVLLPTVIFLVLHPVIARLVTRFSQWNLKGIVVLMNKYVDGMDMRTDEWSKFSQLTFGVLWPATVFILLALIVAHIVIFIFTVVWHAGGGLDRN